MARLGVHVWRVYCVAAASILNKEESCKVLKSKTNIIMKSNDRASLYWNLINVHLHFWHVTTEVLSFNFFNIVLDSTESNKSNRFVLDL